LKQAAAAAGALPLVLLPGTLCDSRIWLAHTAALSRQREVIVPQIGLEVSLSSEASRLLATCPGVSRSAVFRWVRSWPSNWCARPGTDGGLCIVSSTARADAPRNLTLRRLQLERFEAGEVQALMEQEMLPGYFHPGADAESRQRWSERVLSMARETPAAVFRNQVRYAISRPDSMSTLAAMQVPVQVQCGQNDQLCPPQRQAEMVFVRSGCSLVRVPDCGHFLPIEAERSSIISMEKWLDCVGNGIPELAA
jgi:pimeloyl-ACP methyl ester carboxylesterase